MIPLTAIVGFSKYREVLNFRTPENFAVIYLKFKQEAKPLGN